MTNHRPIVRALLFSILLPTLVLLGNTSYAQDGKALFQSNCASCHSPIKVITGPALKGVRERVPDNNLLHAWIKNNQKVLASGNPYFTKLFNDFNKTPMNVFEGSLTDKDIDAILSYVENFKAAPTTPEGGPGKETADGKGAESDNTLLYGIDAIEQRIVAFGAFSICSFLTRTTLRSRWRCLEVFHIRKDSIDILVRKRTLEDVHRRLVEVIEQLREIRVPRGQHLLVVLDPGVQKVVIRYPFSDTLQCRTSNNFDRTVTRGTIRLKQSFTVLSI